jgi:hypothetical protein
MTWKERQPVIHLVKDKDHVLATLYDAITQ